MARQNVTLSLDRDIYEKYKNFCQKKAIALSRSVELFMEERINEKK
ncbi:MAG: hypothetical protein KJ709_00165 [Nanoarchaeota archaeon]|nr:hypothetical protein [Nanoarchaeota archaeon]